MVKRNNLSSWAFKGSRQPCYLE